MNGRKMISRGSEAEIVGHAAIAAKPHEYCDLWVTCGILNT
jgi:hypothetical protein